MPADAISKYVPTTPMLGWDCRYAVCFSQALRQANIVAIHRSDEFATGSRDAAVPRRRRAAIAIKVNWTNAIIAAGVIAHDRRRGIRGAIVHNDKFQVTEGLRQNTVDRFSEVALAVVDGHDD